MKAKKSKYTLRNILKVISTMTDRAIPSDILEFLEEEYYSQSKKQNIEYGDMDLTHLLRVYLKSEQYLNELREERVKTVEQLEKIKSLLGGK
jgi:hypothetical protein